MVSVHAVNKRGAQAGRQATFMSNVSKYLDDVYLVPRDRSARHQLLAVFWPGLKHPLDAREGLTFVDGFNTLATETQ